MELRFLMPRHRKNSVRDRMVGKKWIYSDSERSILHRQSVGHHRGWVWLRNVVWLVFIGRVISHASEWEDSVQSLSCVRLFVTPGLQHARLPCPSPTPGAYSNSWPSSRWCHPTTSSSVVPFSSRLQSFPATGTFPVSQFFTSGGQSIGASASASFLPMNIQDWSPLEWTGWISLQSKGLSRVFSNTTVQKHQFFGAQLSL